MQEVVTQETDSKLHLTESTTREKLDEIDVVADKAEQMTEDKALDDDDEKDTEADEESEYQEWKLRYEKDTEIAKAFGDFDVDEEEEFQEWRRALKHREAGGDEKDTEEEDEEDEEDSYSNL